MSVEALVRDNLSTPVQFAEITIIQTPVEPFTNTPTRIEMVSGLGENSVLTEETGFVLRLEINRFYNDLNFALSSDKSLVEALKIATDELVVNIRDYEVEFIKSKTVIPHLNKFDVIDGTQRMVGNNGRPVVDAISSQERNGSVLEAAMSVESFLSSAEANSYAVIMNPSGWSGYELRHKNAQVMVSWKDQEGTLKGLTFVTDLSQEQARHVMISLGVTVNTSEVGFDSSEVEEKERVANIVRNPALLSFPGSGSNPFEYVFDKILAIRGYGDIKLLQKDNSVEIRSVEQTRADIKRLDELLVFDQEEEEYVAELQEFIMSRAFLIGDKSTQERIAKKIEDTILKLAREHLRKNDTSWKGMPSDYRESRQYDYASRAIQDRFSQNNDNFRPEIAFLKSRGGCPTGGSSAARALGGVSLSAAISTVGLIGGFGESDSMGSLYFPCPACGAINKRPKEGYVELCQNPNCPSPEAVACKSSGTEKEEQEEDSKVIAFPAAASSQSSVSVGLPKAA